MTRYIALSRRRRMARDQPRAIYSLDPFWASFDPATADKGRQELDEQVRMSTKEARKDDKVLLASADGEDDKDHNVHVRERPARSSC